MKLGAFGLDILVVPPLIRFKRTLCLPDQVDAISVLEHDRPVRVVQSDRGVNSEPGWKFHEELHVLVVVETLRETSLHFGVDLDVVEKRLRIALDLGKPSSVPLNFLAGIEFEPTQLPVQAGNRLVGDAIDHLFAHRSVDPRRDQYRECLWSMSEVREAS